MITITLVGLSILPGVEGDDIRLSRGLQDMVDLDHSRPAERAAADQVEPSNLTLLCAPPPSSDKP